MNLLNDDDIINSIPTVKICIVGNSGVGKSQLSTRLESVCNRSWSILKNKGSRSSSPSNSLSTPSNSALSSPSSPPSSSSSIFGPSYTSEFSTFYQPTLGCEIHLLASLHPKFGRYFVEIWDIGGNPSFASSRATFYNNTDGFLFVWDCSSELTYHSLAGWLDEILMYSNTNYHPMRDRTESASLFQNISSLIPPTDQRARARTFSAGISSPTKAPSAVAEGGVPLTIVGNKVDKLSANRRKDLTIACPQHILVSSRTNDFNPTPFYDFFNQVYDRSRHARGTPDEYEGSWDDIASKMQQQSFDLENNLEGTVREWSEKRDESCSTIEIASGSTSGASLRHRNAYL